MNRSLPAAEHRHYDTHRNTQGGHAASMAVDRATYLACMVRDEGPDATGAYLDNLDTSQLYALVVTLAAMVPIDQPADELLAWVKPYSDHAYKTRERARSTTRRTTRRNANQETGTAA